jgi:cobalt-zinc-cadmium resistance protein CzcA
VYSSNAKRALQVARTREQAGEGTKLERVNAETETSDAELRLLQVTSELTSAELRLGLLCGIAEPRTTIDSIIPKPSPDATTFDIRESPRLKILEQQVRTADQHYRMSTSQYLPDMSVGYFTQTLIGTAMGGTPQAFATSRDRFTGFTLGLSLPLWFFSTSARVEQSRLGKQIAEQQLQYGRTTLSVEQLQLRSAIEVARTSVNFYATRALTESGLLVQQSQQSYEAGEASWLEFQSAMQRHLNVNLMDIEARHRLVSLLFQFELLSGTQQ